ncbi:pimeloyl-ACP methyl ester carboxylesterase [Sedimentibacter acidaminivorans]|uniref:Pimeloyl-ACP methyl ester carboxylesterase n=1 Tax=Sedimentibacter acidaminivorans TaxID=913099 RepID=A0ABS4GHK8_9FIRM|nr:alpha/beta hydrolase [Sedimentibacter acidaminivorans]MBP1927190.1 pimeloyl-ACP methyl ester carboxylesterase [Sedimentibacter acidaminivorans]
MPYLRGEELEPVYDAMSKNSPHVMYSMWIAMSANDYRDVLDKITVPTYIIYGKSSTLYSQETAYYMESKIPNAKIIPFENCTHFLVAENPKKFSESVLEAVSSI